MTPIYSAMDWFVDMVNDYKRKVMNACHHPYCLLFQDIIPGVYRALAKISVDLAYVLGEVMSLHVLCLH